MKYIEKFIKETMFVVPTGDVNYTEGFEDGQYELTVNGKNTGIYFMVEDYATWLEKQLDKSIEVPDNTEKSSEMRDENVYRKTDRGDFVPFGVVAGENYLPDGIWYVRHYDYSHGATSCNYLEGLYRKCMPDIPEIEQICGLEEYVHYVTSTDEFRQLLDSREGCSIQDLVRISIAKAFEYNNKHKEQ